MLWSLAVRSSCMLVWLVMSVSWTHVSGNSLIKLSSELFKAKSSTVYTGVYGSGTPISDLVNEFIHVSYLPFCHHSDTNTHILELYRTDTKTVISRSNVPVAALKRIYWPPSALYPNDSATYQCRTSSTDVAKDSFLLSVVVSVNITQLNINITQLERGGVFVNRSSLVTCCADGYPKPSVTINVTGSSSVNISKSNGIFTTCRTVDWSLPMKNKTEFLYVMCEAELAPFRCTAKPQVAHTLCAATTTKTNATAFVVSTSTSTAAQATQQPSTSSSSSQVNSTSTSTSAQATQQPSTSSSSSQVNSTSTITAAQATQQPSTSSSSSQATDKSSSSKAAVIAGSVIGGGVVIVALIIGVYLCFYRKKPCRSGG